MNNMNPEAAPIITPSARTSGQLGNPEKPLRILATSGVWQGADDYAYVRAFRRAGYSVAAACDERFMSAGWRNIGLRLLRRSMEPLMVREFERHLIAEAEQLKPDLFFVFKGAYVTPNAIRAVKAGGAVAINLYPDVSFMAHGKYLPHALPLYDWVFTTKTFGLPDMHKLLNISNASFIPPAFDPEVHAPFALSTSDHERYDADISFIGTWSPKKQRALQRIKAAFPAARLRIWGWHWEKANAPELRDDIMHSTVTGPEYAKCIRASRINLGLLSEVVEGASSGDRITARTFHIPASGGFMLHERTDEVVEYFTEDRECALYGDDDEMIAKIGYYLAHEPERLAIADAGRVRSLTSGYSVDARIDVILAKYFELASLR